MRFAFRLRLAFDSELVCPLISDKFALKCKYCFRNQIICYEKNLSLVGLEVEKTFSLIARQKQKIKLSAKCMRCVSEWPTED